VSLLRAAVSVSGDAPLRASRERVGEWRVLEPAVKTGSTIQSGAEQ
jgi:hypothetical protein